MDKCKNCINYQDTGSAIEGFCSFWHMFVLNDDTCEDFEEGE